MVHKKAVTVRKVRLARLGPKWAKVRKARFVPKRSKFEGKKGKKK